MSVAHFMNERMCMKLIFVDIFRTPFHRDVFGSYSWSSNVIGRKHWLMLPPGEEIKLLNELGKLPFEIDLELLKSKDVKYFEIVQEPGETIFVPTQWYHQVKNLEDTVSINHNWFNGCNIETIVRNLIKHLKDVEKEIADCNDMENFDEHCQLMLKCWFGMDIDEMSEILEHLKEKRTSDSMLQVFDEFVIGDMHRKFDLMKIECALALIETYELSTFD